MSLDTEVNLGPNDGVLDGVAAPPKSSDVNKTTSHKAKAKAREPKAKAKNFPHSPRPGQGQGHSRHTATVLDQNNTSDVIYLLQSIAVNDKNKIPFITSASIF